MKKGLDIARGFYEDFGRPMIREQFPELEGLIAVGLTGAGSECFGYDDDISRDHDFEPGFCLFLPGEDVVGRKQAFALERAYAKLPREYEGLTRSLMGPVGGVRRGVLRTSGYFEEKCGSGDGILTVGDWLRIPSFYLAEATNGEIFRDDLGEVTAIRERLAAYPEDIRKKKLAGHLLLMAQAGQYNYRRCLLHGETGAAQLAVLRFVQSAISSAFLLNNTYEPYYKWAFRGLRGLPVLGTIAGPLEGLMTTDNDPDITADKYAVIEEVAAAFITVLKEQALTRATCGDLEKHAYSVNDGIEDAGIRNMNILGAV